MPIFRIGLATIGVMLLVLGSIAMTGTDEGGWLRILPAIPLATLSTWLNPAARHGLFWESAHSPPFLNASGLVLVYFLPAAAFILGGMRRHGARPNAASDAALPD